jgi:hypothetical protein
MKCNHWHANIAKIQGFDLLASSPDATAHVIASVAHSGGEVAHAIAVSETGDIRRTNESKIYNVQSTPHFANVFALLHWLGGTCEALHRRDGPWFANAK